MIDNNLSNIIEKLKEEEYTTYKNTRPNNVEEKKQSNTYWTIIMIMFVFEIVGSIIVGTTFQSFATGVFAVGICIVFTLFLLLLTDILKTLEEIREKIKV